MVEQSGSRAIATRVEGSFELDMTCVGCGEPFPVAVQMRVEAAFHTLILTGVPCPGCGATHSIQLIPGAMNPAAPEPEPDDLTLN